jgi:hypothetical protein
VTPVALNPSRTFLGVGITGGSFGVNTATVVPETGQRLACGEPDNPSHVTCNTRYRKVEQAPFKLPVSSAKRKYPRLTSLHAVKRRCSHEATALSANVLMSVGCAATPLQYTKVRCRNRLGECCRARTVQNQRQLVIVNRALHRWRRLIVDPVRLIELEDVAEQRSFDHFNARSNLGDGRLNKVTFDLV